MQASPLQLKQYFLTKLSVDQRDKRLSEPTYGPCEFEGVEVAVSLEHGVAADEAKDPRNFLLRLGLTFGDKGEGKIPYDVCIELVGFFEISPMVEKKKRSALVLANGAAILYSAARETISSLTGRFAKGVVMLPSVNFVDDAKRLQTEGEERQSDTLAKVREAGKAKADQNHK